MEGTNTQKSVLDCNLFEILVKKYENYIEINSSKEKKEIILDLFENHNHLKTQEEFDEIQLLLQYACRKSYYDLIKILLSETIENDSNSMVFKIDETNKTASLFKVNQKLDHIIVPKTVKHKLNAYLVTSISNLGYQFYSNIKTIEFEEDSSVNTIYGCSFSRSNIEEIHFPKSLIDLKKGWCSDTEKLTKIIISPSNDQFLFKEDKYLYGKNDPKKDEFDTLLFVRRDIEEISIRPNIKVIESWSFARSIINEIFIPLSVKKICECAFLNCKNLRKIEFAPNSDLQLIESYAFSNSNINEIFIPSSVTKISEGSFSNCTNLRKIEIPINSDLKIIESYAFSNSSIDVIFIPPKVTKINSNTFSKCKNLIRVEIPLNSNLQMIESYSFSDLKIEEIFIPSKVSKICSNAFSNCKNLRKVTIPQNSNLQIIESHAFSNSSINEIFLPSKVFKICSNAFYRCKSLQIIEISEESELKSFPLSAFDIHSKFIIMIPSSLIKFNHYIDI